MNQSEQAPIVNFDVDKAQYIGDDNDGVYYQIAKGAQGWFVTAVVDSDTGSFVDNLFVDDGPYDSAFEAERAGRDAAVTWCHDNEVSYGDDDMCEPSADEIAQEIEREDNERGIVHVDGRRWLPDEKSPR